MYERLQRIRKCAVVAALGIAALLLGPEMGRGLGVGTIVGSGAAGSTVIAL